MKEKVDGGFYTSTLKADAGFAIISYAMFGMDACLFKQSL